MTTFNNIYIFYIKTKTGKVVDRNRVVAKNPEEAWDIALYKLLPEYKVNNHVREDLYIQMKFN